MTRLTLAEARRVALAAQGFVGSGRLKGRSAAALGRLFDRVGLVQIDSVNVFVRAHYLPAFSRLGPYDAALLDSMAWGPRRTLFEYWGHEASLIPMALQPAFRWRMADAASGRGLWKGVRRFAEENAALVASARETITRSGPLGAGEIDLGARRAGGWWGWSDAKRALEWLFWTGQVTTAGRRGFERLYDLTERALPQSVITAPTPTRREAFMTLVDLAGRACGVGSAADLRDYFRLPPQETRAAIADLVEVGRLRPVEVDGFNGRDAYLHAEAEVPSRGPATALLSPFDSLVWNRDRVERLWGFRYRIEIYTPAHRREHGYYVLPFLRGGALVARVDLKAERKAGFLSVKAASLETGQKADRVAPDLAAALLQAARWRDLVEVRVQGDGTLAQALRRALSSETVMGEPEGRDEV